MNLTCSVDREVQILYLAILAKDFFEMLLVDVLGESLDDNLPLSLVSLEAAGYTRRAVAR